ncbi:MAG TPA: ABC transporter permease [Rhodocyclaceae bacterium]|nr:ABC transporter permease [Rhodocyclaceae bacterium]
MLWKLARRNLVRQRTRTAMTLFAIVVGVTSLILAGGFVADMITQLGEAFIGSQTGHLQIATPAYFGSSNRPAEELLLKDVASLKRQVATVPHVRDVMGRLSFTGVVNNGKRDYSILGQGIQPSSENQLGQQIQIVAGRNLKDEDESGVMIGEGLAATMGLHDGDVVTLVASTPDGALNTADLDVIGIFRSFSKDYDARAVRITLQSAQNLLATDKVNLLVARLDQTRNTDLVANQMRALPALRSLTVREWYTLSDFYSKTVELYQRQFGVLQFIVLAMVLLSVANSVNMSAFERIAEFGTMRALGTKHREVMLLILAESVVLGFAGAVLGMLLGALAALAISMIGIPMPPVPGSEMGYTAHISLAFTSIASAGLIGFTATVLASIPPALRSCRIPLVDALRRAI